MLFRSAGESYRPPVAETPVVPEAPVPAPTPVADRLEALRSRLTPQTAEELAQVEAYNRLTPAEKAAQTRAEKTQPMAPVEPKSIATTPESVVQSTMEKKYPLTTNPKDYDPTTGRYTPEYYSPETGKYMSPEERRWRNEMAATEISSRVEQQQIGETGKGKKAKPVMGEVKITEYNPKTWQENIQPDINWTSMRKEVKPGSEAYPVFVLEGTKDGIDYTLKMDMRSAHMGQLFANIQGKQTPVKQWYSEIGRAHV